MNDQPSAETSVSIGEPGLLVDRGISIIDLDRTLTRRGTYSPFLLYFAWHHAPWRLLLVPAVLVCMSAYKLRVISRKRLKEAMHRMMIGTRVNRSVVEPIVTLFAEREVRLHCFDEGRALIRDELAEGRMVIIATAAHRLYAKQIAERLGVDRVVATESTWRENTLYPAASGDNCRGAEKLRRVEHYVRKIGIRRELCHVRFYSDDLADRHLFDWSDEPIAVNPSRRLRKMAAGAGWAIMDWRRARTAPQGRSPPGIRTQRPVRS